MSERSWGIDNEYGRLNDVLLGRPEFFRWVDAGAITQRVLYNTKEFGVEFNLHGSSKMDRLRRPQLAQMQSVGCETSQISMQLVECSHQYQLLGSVSCNIGASGRLSGCARRLGDRVAAWQGVRVR